MHCRLYLTTKAMDQSHVSLVTMQLRQQAFEMYRCDRSLSLGINLPNLSKILKCAGNDDSVKITANDEGADTAEFVFESSNGDRISHFELKLMDIDSDHLGVPEDDRYTAVIRMPSTEYRRIFTDLATIGDLVTIDVSKQNATFSVDGTIGKGALTIQQSDAADEEDEAITITVEEPTKMTFPGSYLTQFAKAVPMSSKVVMGLHNDMPLAVEFTLPNEDGYVRFFVAPKMEEDEENESDAN